MSFDAPSVPPPPPPGSPPPAPPGPDPIPWEQPGVALLSALGETIKLVVASPVQAFQRVPVNSEFVRPLLYAVILGTVTGFVSWMWQSVLGDMTRFMPQGNGDMDMAEYDWMRYTSSVAFVFLLPVLITVALFIWSALAHLFLMLVGGANRGYLATFKALCYTETSSLASLVPLCGDVLRGIWGIVLAVIGIREVHGTTTGKAALAVLLPAVLFCVCLGVLFAVFSAAIIGAMGG